MDMTGTVTHMRVKLYGRKQIIEIEAPSIRDAMMQAVGQMARVSAAFRGKCVIEFSPQPLDKDDTVDPAAGLDMSLVIQSDDRFSDWTDTMLGDPDLKQYMALTHRPNYDRTPPQKIWELEEYVRDKYSATDWWDVEIKEAADLIATYKPRMS